MSPLSLAWRDRFRRKPVRERSSRSLLVRMRSISTGNMRSCSRATWLRTDAHCSTKRQTFHTWDKLRLLYLNFFFFFLQENWWIFLTLLSPAVMFCRAPAAASRVVELISHWCSTRLYTPIIWGCHSHSMPFGTRATSVKVERSWFFLCQGKGHRRRRCWDGWSGPCEQNGGWWVNLTCTYVFGFLALRCKATNGFPFPCVLRSGWSFQAQYSRWRHLTVELVGEVPQDTHCIFHPLRTYTETD